MKTVEEDVIDNGVLSPAKSYSLLFLCFPPPRRRKIGWRHWPLKHTVNSLFSYQSAVQCCSCWGETTGWTLEPSCFQDFRKVSLVVCWTIFDVVVTCSTKVSLFVLRNYIFVELPSCFATWALLDFLTVVV